MYNTIILLDDKLHSFILDASSDTNVIKHSHKQLFDIMVTKKFIISNDHNELKEIERIINDTNTNNKKFEIVINPTINCNFECWYCYEVHNNKDVMSENDINSIIALVRNVVNSNRNIKTIDVHWFGGEPLLHYNDVIKPILENIKAITLESNIDLNSGMTTNGYLINNEILEFLKMHNHKNFQITLDGNKDKHNRVRYSKNDHNTFDVIVNNIINCIKHQFYVSVRLNISLDTNINVEELLRDFSSLSELERTYMCFSIHKVWQEPDEVEIIVDEIKDKIRLQGFKAVTYHSNPTTILNTCYADKTNHVTVNPNGLIYKCTARDFTQKNVEGYLLKNGVIKWEPIYYIRKDATILMRDSCRECQILPICNGGCSQKKIENQNNQCLYNFDSQSKLEFAKKIIYCKLLEQ